MVKLKTNHVYNEQVEFTFQLTAIPSGIMNLLHEMKIIFIQQKLKQLQQTCLIFDLL